MSTVLIFISIKVLIIMKKRITIKESDLRRMVKESVRTILNEQQWGDGTEQQMAYHVLTFGDEMSSQEEADDAYNYYDWLTHNQITADEVIQELTGGDAVAEAEPEVVPRSAHCFGTSNDGRYMLTYDKFTGAFDVWEME